MKKLRPIRGERKRTDNSVGNAWQRPTTMTIKGDFSLNGKRVGEIGYFGKRLKDGLAINFPKTF